MQSRSLGFAGF